MCDVVLGEAVYCILIPRARVSLVLDIFLFIKADEVRGEEAYSSLNQLRIRM